MSASATAYSQGFYAEQTVGSLASARIVVPIVLQFVQAKSVCDVGCGLATWLCTFAQNGILDITGFDGEWASRQDLFIAPWKFKPTDLREPLPITRTYDLACSLEVAEHLPASGADGFVDSLTKLAPVVLFSAAVPQQGGTEHINEQWLSHWKAKFEARGFTLIDCIRPKIWADRNVEWWYRQNIVLFASREGLDRNPALAAAASAQPGMPIDVVHPDCYAQKKNPEYFIGNLISLPRLFGDALARKLRK